MLVYGDADRRLGAGAALRLVEAALGRAAAATGLARHEALIEALIEAGAVAQAVADAGFAARGEVDELDPAAEAALDLARAVAGLAAASWRSGFAAPALPVADACAALAALRRLDLPDRLVLREPEGFVHYAVYPEAYAEAARAIPDGPLCVVGLRSIGTALAAMVAAARPADLALTLRPTGHPFRREIRLGPALRGLLAARAGRCRFAVVDEGPGLSGSSVAAAVEALEAVGAAPGRIHVLPSHGGAPGREAGETVRRAWSRVRRHAVTFDDIAAPPPGGVHRLASWCADLVGEARGPLREISGGRWRDALGLPEEDRPPVLPWQERRKFLLRTESGVWLLRFAGLGRAGRRKLEIARRLRGVVPDVVGLRHGFLVERWMAGARPLRTGEPAPLGELGRYLALRAGLDAPPGSPGASPGDLLAMLLHNAGEALGPEARSAAAARWEREMDRLSALHRPVLTDNRLQPWEWIEVEGRWLKTDALDHHAGHDLVGAQDIAWDVAGAAVEFGLAPPAVARIRTVLERTTGCPVDHDLVRFMTAAYAAFQLGHWTIAGDVPGEEGRIAAARARYGAALGKCLT